MATKPPEPAAKAPARTVEPVGEFAAGRTLERALDKLGPLGKSDPAEPVFVLTGRDVCALVPLEEYSTQLRSHGVTGEKLRGAMRALDAFREWQRAHGSKVPD